MLSSKSSMNFKEPMQAAPEPEAGSGDAKGPLKYYSEDIHKAAFVLPQFAKKALNL